MGISETVRRSKWHRHPLGRRVMSDNPPYFSIAEPDDGGDRDGSRRRSLAGTANLDA